MGAGCFFAKYKKSIDYLREKCYIVIAGCYSIFRMHFLGRSNVRC
nr:MAG TPA: hypothetical protein [Caudoviricetes sp.]